MSNLIQNTTNLQNILTTINDLPEAGEGSDFATCTVSITASRTAPIYGCLATTVADDGSLSRVIFPYNPGAQTLSINISNVLCGSTIVVRAGTTYTGRSYTTSEMTLLNSTYWKDTNNPVAYLQAPTVAGTTGTVAIS